MTSENKTNNDTKQTKKIELLEKEILVLLEENKRLCQEMAVLQENLDVLSYKYNRLLTGKW